MSFSPRANSSHPIATRLLTLWLSFGAHYLVASNLGLLGFLYPPRLKPVVSPVKVVDLTAAEQNRVPAVVKSEPAPIAPTAINPTVASPAAGGLGSRGGAYRPPVVAATPTPRPAPAPERSPEPSGTSVSKPRSSLGVDPNNRFASFSPSSGSLRGTNDGNGGGDGTNSGNTTTRESSLPPSSSKPPSTKPPKPPIVPPPETLEDVNKRLSKELQDQNRVTPIQELPLPNPLIVNNFKERTTCTQKDDLYIVVAMIFSVKDFPSQPKEPGELPVQSEVKHSASKHFDSNDLTSRNLLFEAYNEASKIAGQAYQRKLIAEKDPHQGKDIRYRVPFKYRKESCINTRDKNEVKED